MCDAIEHGIDERAMFLFRKTTRDLNVLVNHHSRGNFRSVYEFPDSSAQNGTKNRVDALQTPVLAEGRSNGAVDRNLPMRYA